MNFNFAKEFYLETLLDYLLLKLNYISLRNFINFKNLFLNINLYENKFNNKFLIILYLIINLLTLKTKNNFLKRKKLKMSLKLQKGFFIGCRLKFNKNNLFFFLFKLYLLNIKCFENFIISEFFYFYQLEKFFYKFENLFFINLNFEQSLKNKLEFNLLLKFFKNN